MSNFFLLGLIFRPSAAVGALRPAVHPPGSILALIATILGGTPPDSAPYAQKKNLALRAIYSISDRPPDF
ncbi:hypothetical protein B0H17DRAFT_1180120, partial [Mycena rosella]